MSVPVGEALIGRVVDSLGHPIDGKDAIDTGVDTTSVGVNAIIGTIQELLDFFSRFSFI
jgi:F0F1-type ATP synthase alpha subunit